MTKTPAMKEPDDADARRAAKPVICYEIESLPPPPEPVWLDKWRSSLRVPAGYGFRIVSIEGAQVGDLNLWNANDLGERFFSGKTRQLQATHLTRGDHLWSTMPQMRPMASITHDSLEWYGWDEDGAGVHDVIGTRCDPYTNHQLRQLHYHNCCHSNLTRALSDETGLDLEQAQAAVHDVLNVFMCTGFTRESHQYFMKASPVRPGDAIEFLAQIDLLCALSACPGGDCGQDHSDDRIQCHPLLVEILKPDDALIQDWESPSPSAYDGTHGRW